MEVIEKESPRSTPIRIWRAVLRDGSHEGKFVSRIFDNHDMVSGQHEHWALGTVASEVVAVACCYFLLGISILEVRAIENISVVLHLRI